jgi:pyruvate/2-oxoglutarate dehydrogenase complex dihydrolipoamide acyltransferase (E2) component
VSELLLDDLELELRKLPGVRAAGFDARDELLIIQLHVVPGSAREALLPLAATRIAARHADRPVAVEVVRWRDTGPEGQAGEQAVSTPSAPATPSDTPAPPAEPSTGTAPAAESQASHRMRLLAVLSFPDTDELEVHLILEGRRTIGRAPASRGLVAAIDATLAAAREFGFSLAATPRWVRPVESSEEEALIAVALDESEPGERILYGVAPGTSPTDAAARATLDAINRRAIRT